MSHAEGGGSLIDGCENVSESWRVHSGCARKGRREVHGNVRTALTTAPRPAPNRARVTRRSATQGTNLDGATGAVLGRETGAASEESKELMKERRTEKYRAGSISTTFSCPAEEMRACVQRLSIARATLSGTGHAPALHPLPCHTRTLLHLAVLTPSCTILRPPTPRHKWVRSLHLLL